MLTRNGIELDIEKSKYKYTYKGLTFYFSSMFYLNKFKREIQNYIDNETKKLYNKFKINADFTILLSVALYMRIEKRGFQVLVHDKEPIQINYLAVKL